LNRLIPPNAIEIYGDDQFTVLKGERAAQPFRAQDFVAGSLSADETSRMLSFDSGVM
jgi:hypothetical protein